jgi:hypothetical protein
MIARDGTLGGDLRLYKQCSGPERPVIAAAGAHGR